MLPYDMCIKLPQNLKSFLEVNGVGHTKANRYGAVYQTNKSLLPKIKNIE